MRPYLLGMALLALTGLAYGQRHPSLEERVDRLERTLHNQSLSELVLQVEQLQLGGSGCGAKSKCRVTPRNVAHPAVSGIPFPIQNPWTRRPASPVPPGARNRNRRRWSPGVRHLRPLDHRPVLPWTGQRRQSRTTTPIGHHHLIGRRRRIGHHPWIGGQRQLRSWMPAPVPEATAATPFTKRRSSNSGKAITTRPSVVSIAI